MYTGEAEHVLNDKPLPHLRKRQRLSQVLNKLTKANGKAKPGTDQGSDFLMDSDPKADLFLQNGKMVAKLESGEKEIRGVAEAERVGAEAEAEDEMMRTSPDHSNTPAPPPYPSFKSSRPSFTVRGDVFRFDSFDKERYLYRTISEEEEDVFSPASSQRSPHSPTDSPLLSSDSPQASISPLRLKDNCPDEEALEGPGVRDRLSVIPPLPKYNIRVSEYKETSSYHADSSSVSSSSSPTSSKPPPLSTLVHFPMCSCHHCQVLSGHVPLPGSHSPLPLSRTSFLRPPTPRSPLSPQSLRPIDRLISASYLTGLYRKRSQSDSDLQKWMAEPKGKTGERGEDEEEGEAEAEEEERGRRKPGSRSAEESIVSPSPQESPLDLRVRRERTEVSSTSSSSSSRGRGSLGSDGAPSSPRLLLRLPLEQSASTREENRTSTSEGSDVAYVCPICGQMFSLHDRLAKHMASRHKSRPTEPGVKAYMCDVCKRSFTRSDMLTRHMRLHTGVKPYTCHSCGQVFSRSDHLSTHQRTHTGEKPYRCPQCPYAACRRDMITRHMRTHARYEPLEPGSGSPDEIPLSRIRPFSDPPYSPTEALSALSVESPLSQHSSPGRDVTRE
ncbi:unnamed protein product [Darwinula stevensoni]|uniref:C2H2-type domain-containing protein n=1 Tax=Darwinula stevensoni TaxID=69355 RepID=A0A7R9ACR5_9CRUS|nr:unnamed protein product [Darwinula stevensoni]CAG0900067.1 unnamed protein product [Darwinula stevensoni]